MSTKAGEPTLRPKLKSERIEKLIADQPAWRPTGDRRGLVRTLRAASCDEALARLRRVIDLAREIGLCPARLELEGRRLTIDVADSDADAVTAASLELAEAVERELSRTDGCGDGQ